METPLPHIVISLSRFFKITGRESRVFFFAAASPERSPPTIRALTSINVLHVLATQMLRRFTMAMVVLAAATALLFVALPASSRPRELIEQTAVDSIDFAQLEPPIARFIELARDHKAIGRKTSEFPGLWQYSFKAEHNQQGRINTEFIPPMTREHQTKYVRVMQEGVPCWPMLIIRVDPSSSTIIGVAVYTQCL